MVGCPHHYWFAMRIWLRGIDDADFPVFARYKKGKTCEDLDAAVARGSELATSRASGIDERWAATINSIYASAISDEILSILEVDAHKDLDDYRRSLGFSSN
ncbi:hypothetical protein CMI48_02325 [Candidatus Pacearchaeota archaeon]|nr:hypothetical protein [Candidatus Pacearchaeota archaeon]|tara:strand:- start:78 stop:383 length:306 start_codon:yes stop_codon:yes gene_type:complete